MYYEVSIFGFTDNTVETVTRPISSQSEPTYELKLVITASKHECASGNNHNKCGGKCNDNNRSNSGNNSDNSNNKSYCLHTINGRLYYTKAFSKRRPKLKVLTEYLSEKISHCKHNTHIPITVAKCCCTNIERRNGSWSRAKNNSKNKEKSPQISQEQQLIVYQVNIKCNIEWLISVIETEIDYHLGKKNCTKKCNEKYMNEYIATQLSGFGEKFYHSSDNISNSIVAKIYKLNIKT